MVADWWPSKNRHLVRQIQRDIRVVVLSILALQSVFELNHVLEGSAGSTRLALKRPFANQLLYFGLQNRVGNKQGVLRLNYSFSDASIGGNR